MQCRKLVGVPEKMIRVGAVMPHQPLQGRAVAQPVALAQRVRPGLVEVEIVLQRLRHGPVHVRENVRAGIVQGVVEVEHPGSRRFQSFARIKVPTPSSVRTSSSNACST